MTGTSSDYETYRKIDKNVNLIATEILDVCTANSR